jgi:hypothetical protein
LKWGGELLISEEYKRQNEMMHDTNSEYGVSGQKFAKFVIKLLQGLGYQDSGCTVLDYGCGKSTLRQALQNFENGTVAADGNWQDYDPCIPGKDTLPNPADLVVCTDVMEHIEEDCLDAVLDDLRGLTKQRLFLSVATRPAQKTLQDGRNAHLIVKPAKWWVPKFLDRFDIFLFQKIDAGEFIIVLE